MGRMILTVQASVIGLDMRLLYLSVLNDKSVPLAPGTPEDGGGTVEVEVEGFCEFELRIGDKANLEPSVICCVMLGEVDPLHRSCRRGRALCSTRSFCCSESACAFPNRFAPWG
jgi:hypothetical protein